MNIMIVIITITHIEVDSSAIGLIVDNSNWQVNRVDPDGDAGEDHEDAGQEEDEDEENWVPLHRDPVLDEEGKDVPGRGQGDPHLFPFLRILHRKVKVRLLWLTGARIQLVFFYLV